MKFCIVLLSFAAACQAVSFFELVVDEWQTFKVSEFYRHLILFYFLFYFILFYFCGACDDVKFTDISDVKNKLHRLSGMFPLFSYSHDDESLMEQSSVVLQRSYTYEDEGSV
jgi:hypothetical protein